MNLFQSPEATMTPEEAEAVVRRHLERVPDTPNGPSVADVAEALRLSPEEVAKLLAEVRSAPRPKPKRRITSRERRIWLLSGALALALGGGVILTARTMHIGPFRTFESRATGGSKFSYDVTLDGVGIGSANADPVHTPDNFLTGVNRCVNFSEAQNRTVQPSTTIAEAERTLNFARSGNWDRVPNVRFSRFEIRKPDGMGLLMRWARADVPIYTGDDALVAELVKAERAKRIAVAVGAASGDVPPPAGG